jgi:hypothetical protein
MATLNSRRHRGQGEGSAQLQNHVRAIGRISPATAVLLLLQPTELLRRLTTLVPPPRARLGSLNSAGSGSLTSCRYQIGCRTEEQIDASPSPQTTRPIAFALCLCRLPGWSRRGRKSGDESPLECLARHRFDRKPPFHRLPATWAPRGGPSWAIERTSRVFGFDKNLTATRDPCSSLPTAADRTLRGPAGEAEQLTKRGVVEGLRLMGRSGRSWRSQRRPTRRAGRFPRLP